MGRALYSQKYFHQEPVIRTTTPEYERWSSMTNNFDPDSDEFFVDAEYEAFIDPSPPSPIEDSSSSSSSESGGESPMPMAVGNDDPAAMIAAAGMEGDDWRERFLIAGSAYSQEREERENRPPTPTMPMWSPPESWQIRAEDRAPTQSSPIDIPSTPRRSMREPEAEAESVSPRTPRFSYGSPANMSPPPTVSPRLYTWGRVPVTSQTSPLSNMNPAARLSVPRITPVAVRRVQGFAV